jgi:hypothetical protein
VSSVLRLRRHGRERFVCKGERRLRKVALVNEAEKANRVLACIPPPCLSCMRFVLFIEAVASVLCHSHRSTWLNHSSSPSAHALPSKEGEKNDSRSKLAWMGRRASYAVRLSKEGAVCRLRRLGNEGKGGEEGSPAKTTRTKKRAGRPVRPR